MNSMSDETKKLIFIAAGVGAFVGSILLVKWVRKRQQEELETEILPVKDISENTENNPVTTRERSSLDNGFVPANTSNPYWKGTEASPETPSSECFEPTEEGPAEDDNAQDPDYPYMITVEEFSEGKEGYSSVGLYYFADKVLADKNLNPIDGIDSKIGFESLNQFGPSVDTVFVRNDRLKTDYEIIYDARQYIDAFKQKSGDASGDSN